MILKAGTYRFNDNLTEVYPLYQSINFTTTFEGETTDYVGIDLSLYEDTNFCLALKLSVSTERVYFNPVPTGYEDFYPNGWIGGMVFEITITEDTEVDDTFGNWYIANTNYNEVNAKPLAEITYNGETIAQLNAGETATLSCEGKKMASDVVVKVNEVESKIPEGYVKPEGTLNILQNNTTYDVSQYAEVRIATAHPYEVPLEMLMNNVISDASQATIGNVYKYTGETTDTYEQGALYILEEVSK